jgi:protein O-GlcNAc transferase
VAAGVGDSLSRFAVRSGPPTASLAFTLVLLLATGCTRGPQPPDLATLGTLDPEVHELLAEHVMAVRESPGVADPWGTLGMAFEANGFTAPARDAYRTATTLENQHGRWWYRLALMAQRDGDVETALAAFDRAIALSPDFVPARWRRGLLLLDRGDLDGAEAAFRVATNLAPNDPAGAIGLARVFLARNQADQAAARLESLLERAPTDRYAYQLLGAAYRQLGRAEDAQEALAAGAGGEPVWADPWSDEVGALRRGFASSLKDATALAMADRYPAAIALLERLHAERPDDGELRTYLGGVYASAGRLDDAKRLLDASLAAKPDDFEATLHLATAYLFTSDCAAADRLVERALAIRPGSVEATRLRGVVAWRAGRLDDARTLLEAAAAGNPRDARALAWVGSIARDQKRVPEALDAFRRALSRDPLLVEALVGGALTAVETGDSADATRWLARLKRIAPGDARVPELERRVTRGRT